MGDSRVRSARFKGSASLLLALALAACSGAQEPVSGPGSASADPRESEPKELERVTFVDPAPEPEPDEDSPELEQITFIDVVPQPEPEPQPIDPEGLLAESLETYERAIALWERGQMEAAYSELDRAYERMAAVPPNGDPMIAQQKEDLRQLIAERVVEIHTSQHSVASNLNDEIPMDMNQYVQREIESFQGPERKLFLEAYERSGLYRPMIVETLREAGMPDQIGWLPVVESWFKVRAYSRARALGMWQFIASTGYRYGMKRDWWVDERMDPVKATQAAAGYLADLHRLFGDWLTALAAYNCGEGAVKRAINRQSEDYHDQFWDIYTRLPRETRRFVPRFLATLAIIKDPEAYGFELPEPMAPQEFEMIEIVRSTDLASIDTLLQLPKGTSEALNPELRRKATPNEPYSVKVPPGSGQTLLARLEELPEWSAPASITTTYRVRSGDTLGAIAGRYNTSISVLMDLNNLRSAHRLSIGQRLYVPDSRPGGTYGGSSEITYNVRRGDSLWTLAKRYGTTVDRIKRDNSLASETLTTGQSLVIRTGTAGAGTYIVRSGDTLGKIADRNGVSLRALLSVNGLSTRSTIYPGQRLAIPQ